MRVTLIYFALGVVATSVGCQQQSMEPSDRTPELKSPGATTTEPIEATDGSVEPTESDPGEQTMSEGRSDEGPEMSGRGLGMGRGHGGMGRGPGAMGGMREDMTTLHAMFADRDKIKRTVKNLPDGAEATTESDDEAITSLLQEHVPAMEVRVMENKPLPPMTFHPIFVELIKHADDYTLTYEETEQGIKVTYSSDDPFVVMLVQEHAKLVSRFIKNGMEEIHKAYTLPKLTDPEQKDAKALAMAAKDELFARLSSRLTEVMKAKGPAAAIEVCSREATEIAKAVGEEHGVTIGRTALKLRNPANEPPKWVKPLINKQLAEPQYVELAGGHTGALLPIKLKAKCVTCHGSLDKIPPAVKTQLTRLYPQDNATGFEEGDLRGWFWVEVP